MYLVYQDWHRSSPSSPSPPLRSPPIPPTYHKNARWGFSGNPRLYPGTILRPSEWKARPLRQRYSRGQSRCVTINTLSRCITKNCFLGDKYINVSGQNGSQKRRHAGVLPLVKSVRRVFSINYWLALVGIQYIIVLFSSILLEQKMFRSVRRGKRNSNLSSPPLPP